MLLIRILCIPLTGPFIGPSPMASIRLRSCVDFRLSGAS
ncbi:superoxide dismutase, partial [Salmonella enterica subsp. enterica]|nr:superoxide dismutase [Salmonella enterica subsp. enterica serovar Pensacola]